ncbi:MAG TPA: acetylxylan esterase [Thermomicrobiales bacterium]|nr:acetylxylan esterase [Thermomicrobiales bacterium]
MALPADFAAYWDDVDRELAQFPPAAELEHSPRRSTGFATSYNLRLTSLGPYRIFGFYSVPHGDGPFPALLQTPRYGSVNNPPHGNDRQRYVVLTLMHRGQRLADQPFAAAYPGLLTHGIDNPRHYIYRGIVGDCLRGAEWLAARRPVFAALLAQTLMFYRLMEARERTEAYPIEEVNDYLRFFPNQNDNVCHTLSYLDPLHHAPRVRAATLLPTGDPGALGGPEWLQPLAGSLGGPVERYDLTHEGGTDNDWLDAWVAGQLGAPPMPKLWQVAG